VEVLDADNSRKCSSHLSVCLSVCSSSSSASPPPSPSAS
jgi:hypothetical protein